MAGGGIKVEGVRELTRSVAAANRQLAKEFAKQNRRIGQEIIDHLFPRSQSGQGRGALPRATASRNMVEIKAGRTDRRHAKVEDWGLRQVSGDEPRPFILGTARREIPDIEERYLDGVERALKEISAD